jgi:hypothetical protein
VNVAVTAQLMIRPSICWVPAAVPQLAKLVASVFPATLSSEVLNLRAMEHKSQRMLPNGLLHDGPAAHFLQKQVWRAGLALQYTDLTMALRPRKRGLALVAKSCTSTLLEALQYIGWGRPGTRTGPRCTCTALLITCQPPGSWSSYIQTV